MTKREKIRDAILGISEKMIESTSMCYRTNRVESGEGLEDKKRKQLAKWGSFRPDEIVVCAYNTGMFGSLKNGVVFMEDALWEEDAFKVAKKDRKYLNPLRYADIRDVRWNSKESSVFTIVLEDAEVEVYASIYGKFYAEALKRAVEAAGYALKAKKTTSKKKAEAPADEAEKPAETQKPADEDYLAEIIESAKKLTAAETQPAPEVKAESQDIHARITAIERELSELYARKAALEAEEAAARKAAEEAAARKAAEEAAARKAAEEAAARKAAEEAAARKAAEEAAARKAAEEAAARKAAEEAAARKAAEEAAARKAAEEAAEIEEEEDLFEEDEVFEMAQEALMLGETEKAIQYYERAAARGDHNAMCELGNLYGDGIEMDQDVEKALYWYDQADRHGDLVGAVFAAGLVIENARTVDDLEAAKRWIERAEDKGQHTNAKNQRKKLLKKQREIEMRVGAEDLAEKAAGKAAEKEAAASKKDDLKAAKIAARMPIQKAVYSEEEAAEGYYCPECLKKCNPMAGFADHVCPYCGKVNRCEDIRKHKITEEEAANMAFERAAARKAAEEADTKKKQEDERAAEIAALLEDIRAEYVALKAAENKTKPKTSHKVQGKPLTEKTFAELTAYELTQLIRAGKHKHIRSELARNLSVDEEINRLEKEILLELDSPLGGISGARLEQILVQQRMMDSDYGTLYKMGGYLGRKYEALKAEGPTDHARDQIDRCVTVLSYMLQSLKNTDRHNVYIWVTTAEQREAAVNRWNENHQNSWKKKLIRYYTEMRALFIHLYR